MVSINLSTLFAVAALLPSLLAAPSPRAGRTVTIVGEENHQGNKFWLPGAQMPVSTYTFDLAPDGSLPKDTSFERVVYIPPVDEKPPTSPDALVMEFIDKYTFRAKCHLEGKMAEGFTDVTMKFSDGAQYLSRCGPGKDGITVTCGGPKDSDLGPAAHCEGRWTD